MITLSSAGRRRSVIFIVAVCVLFCIPDAWAAGKAASVPAALTSLVERATDAVNARQLASLEPLADGDTAHRFAWIEEVSTRKWDGGVLAVPTTHQPQDAPAYLAVFHAWHTCESDGDHVHRLVQTPQGWRIGDEIPETETNGFRVTDHDLRVTFDIPNRAAHISDRVRIERTRGTATLCLLRLSQDFTVRQLTREDAHDTPVPFQQVGGVLALAPPEGKAFTLSLRYAGVVNHQQGDYILPNEATLNSYWYPHIARLPATATATVTAPPGWTPIAQGEPIKSQRAQDGSLTVTYRNALPTCYFTVDAGRYTITERKVKGRTLAVYLLRPNAGHAQACLDRLERALAFFEDWFSPYPYTRYTLVESLGPFGGALEAYSFATFGPGDLPGALVHELSHTWWGGLVPCTYLHAMWNESFASYSDELFQRLGAQPPGAEPVPNAGSPALRKRRSTPFEGFPLSRARDTSDGQQSSVGYGKGALALRVLEDQVGLEAMRKCLKTFLADHPRGAAAEWPDFEKAVNKATGQDFRWFFAQWMERTGLPVVQLAGVTTTEENGVSLVTAEIVQSGTPYRLRLPVRLETRDGKAVTQIVEVQGTRLSLHLRSEAKPARLILDPNGTLPLLSPPDTPENKDAMTYTFP